MTAQEALNKIAIDYVPVSYRRTIEYLDQNGPSHIVDIAHHLKRGVKSVANMVNDMKHKRIVCVAERVRKENGYITVLYGLGSRDAPNLGRSEKAACKSAREKERRLLANPPKPSVWGSLLCQ